MTLQYNMQLLDELPSNLHFLCLILLLNLIYLIISDLCCKYYGVAHVSMCVCMKSSLNVIKIPHYRYIAEPNHQVGYKLPLCLTIYSGLVTWSYLIIKDPVFHQISYAILVFGVVYRAISLFQKVPKSLSYERPRVHALLWMSALGFIVAFILWNIDNQFCNSLRAWRHTVSFLTGSISEVNKLNISIFHRSSILLKRRILLFLASRMVAHWHR